MEKMPKLSNNMPCFLVTPETVYVDITPKCNLRCRHCYSADKNIKPKEKSYKQVCKILDDLAAAKVFKIHLVGREPLMRKDFEKIINYASQHKFVIGVATNGTLITPSIAKLLSERNIDGVQISIDSICPEKHNDFRRNPNAFSLTFHGIELLRKYNVKVCIATTLTNFNFNELKKIADFANELGAYYYRTRLLIGNDINQNFQITRKQYKYAVQILFNLKNHYKTMKVEQLHHSFLFENKIQYDPSRSLTKLPCNAGYSRCSLTYDFKITPCIALAKLYSAPIKKSFKEEWQNNAVLDRWRNIVKSIKGKCAICGYRYICGGGCRANVFGATHDILSSDPWCWFNPYKHGIK
ncbi:MAG: hypothetical protein CO145_01755 [Candidatus Nealsonbacteria bacterium CG_4_9_14_3_um_filter_37_13]|uniref:Radical SAM core domain-containing protein n=2 Tax=Candidatus Nealsoniibacteriota TaxID=1817911 RepID=A0A2H0TIS3_9BACT|nr:MAG: hypothetical protein COU43_02565 [Candidatus Nealsonbacteria bacterium CG10_big_fil_rev_8_21_14_0_10_37_25]PJA84218.1 MAG: hypothetical protein CO145_01755 [Candidatus Nealsonbacteria bacterium CG_4_9_14_3_um_filter_37_13]